MNETNFSTQTIDSFSNEISNDLENGMHSVLYKRINNVSISDKRIRDAFAMFVKNVECGNSLSVSELINAAESLVKNGDMDESAGNLIYCFDMPSVNNKRIVSKLIKNSVANVYNLFSVHNGLMLNLDAIGGSLNAGETKRFLVMPPKKCVKLVTKAEKIGIQMVHAGQILAENKIMLSSGTEIVASVDKSNVCNSAQSVSITLTEAQFPAFLSGYLSALSDTLCDCITNNNVIRFGIGGGLSDVFARALGYFSAVSEHKHLPDRMVFTSENASGVAVPRPGVSDGDYIYLLRLRCDQNGLPERGHFAQLCYYLSEKKKAGIIKNILPIKANTERVIDRLSGDSLEYVSLASIPEGCFGVAVSVPRGESVNGIPLGYFKNN